MTLSKGDKLVKLDANGNIVQGEAYYKYEVLNWPSTYNADYATNPSDVHCVVLLKKIE